MTRRDALKLGTGTALSAPPLALSSAHLPEQPRIPGTHAESSNEICFMRAVDMVEAIRSKKLSAREVMQAHLKQIHQVNAKVNAMVTMVPEDQLMAQAAAADEALANGKWLGPLHGLPVAVKDLHETHGIRTTYGSPLHKNYVPDFDCRVVQREKEAGAIVLGKTNVPEFGLGSQTFNPVFGPTHNPYDITRPAAEARAAARSRSRAAWLRWPTAAIWAVRCAILPTSAMWWASAPSPGRVSNVPTNLGWFTLSVPGPVARNVTDCAYFLSVLAGYDHHSPISIEQPGAQFAQPLGTAASRECGWPCSRTWDCPGSRK